MKKLVSLTLALLMVFSVAALAAVSPKPTLNFDWEIEHPEFDNKVAFFYIKESSDERKLNSAKDELSKLAAGVDEYLGDAAEAAKAITGSEELTVTEFSPVVVGNYKEEMGSVKVTISAPTTYEDGEPVAVLVGIGGEWTALEGTGTASGKVEVTLDAETILNIQANGGALLALAI